MSKHINDKINDALFNFYLGADKSTINELIKHGIENTAEYDKKKKQILFFVRAKANKQRDERLLALVQKFQEAITRNIERPVAILKQIIQGDSSLAYYSKLDRFSKDDIIEIIKDKNLVELLEQLEIDENNQ